MSMVVVDNYELLRGKLLISALKIKIWRSPLPQSTFVASA